MMIRRSLPLIVLGLVVAAPGAAQDPAAAQQGPPQISETELVFEREIFTYPQFNVGNPFKPLVAADAGGARYDQLRLSGIIYSAEDPSFSVAIFNTSGLTLNDDGTVTAEEGDSYPVKVGQTLGNVTVVEIGIDYVIVDVEEFGIADRKTMRPLNLLGGNQ